MHLSIFIILPEKMKTTYKAEVLLYLENLGFNHISRVKRN